MEGRRACLAALALLGMASMARGAEVFTSAAKVMNCFHQEQDLAQQLETFIEDQELRLERLRGLRRQLVNQSVPDGDHAMTPADGFSVINRLRTVLGEVEQAIRPEGGIVAWLKEQPHLPDESDHRGSAASMLRLQRIYEQDPEELLPAGSAEDYLFVGKAAYDQRDWLSAQQWLELALQATEARGGDEATQLRASVLDHLAYTYYKAEEFDRAINASLEVLELAPQSYRVQDNIHLFRQKKLQKLLNRTYGSNLTTVAADRLHPEDNLLRHTPEEMRMYRSLCRGEAPPKALRLSEAARRCTLEDRGRPELLLKPSRLDHIYGGVIKARVFRDFLSATEAAHLIQIGKDKLRRSLAHNGKEFVETNYRISEVAWIDPAHDAVVADIHRRIALATGLDLRSAEQLQISNYGIGGHYEPHLDAGTRNNFVGSRRLATFMLYLNDVEAGGHTVYPRLGVGNPPSKGDAIFWFNLDPAGEPNDETLHAGCPVLRGSKWVANKWIHLTGNE